MDIIFRRDILYGCCCSVAVMSDSLQPYGLHHAILPFHYLWSLFKLMSIESVMPCSHLILCFLLLLLPSTFLASGSFPMSHLFTSEGQSIGASASASVLPMNIQGWHPLGLTALISLLSKGLSRVFSNTTVQEHQVFGAQLLYDPTVASVHDHWKNHSFDYMDLCWQSDAFGF